MLHKRGKRGVVRSASGITRPRISGEGFLNNKLLIGATTLIGTIVGAGILGIPYVIAKAGFLYGLLLMVGLGLAFIFLNLCMGEIVLRTQQQHQLAGYAHIYLGRWGKNVMTLSMVLYGYGTLAAYLIGEGQALQSIFGAGSTLMWGLLFGVVALFIVYQGMNATGKTELILISLLVLVVGLIGLFSVDLISLDNFSSIDWKFVFLPYGVILFAYNASAVIPEMREELLEDLHKMKKAILVGSIIPIVMYIVFSAIIVGIIGVEQFDLLAPNERIATVALAIYAHPLLGLFANILAVLAMFTSFLTMGVALLEMYRYDYEMPFWGAFVLTFSLPFLIFFFDLTTFIAVLGVTGTFAGGLEAILIVLMFWRAKRFGEREPEFSLPKLRWLGVVLIVLFVLGMLQELWGLFF